MRVSITPTGTGGLPSSPGEKERPPCTFSSPCRKCEIQMILRGQSPGQVSREQVSTRQADHECFQCRSQEHKCKPLSKAKAEASRRLVKAAVEHLFYGEPIKQWDDAIEKAKIVVKAEASFPVPNMPTKCPLVPAPEQVASFITGEVPFENATKTAEIIPAEEVKPDSVPRGMDNNLNAVVIQQKAIISALVKQQTMMVDAMVAMNKDVVSVVEGL
ncbi:hypothetical protein FLAG1_01475 [Fusarium langsethiae]|uniref:Uncharacterized protein n=1 Tax=Fusarium langsethiae TaxID=179993 RepID=A0A0M9F413_FUSLA|nr:hypothetical protein FLAG1_01475 [Fusarium langsethiae]GKU00847.1 unnamed protein product [Fusarium langsethiae]GKU17388.1 unnamed protein product [Fusarium langsethiae]